MAMPSFRPVVVRHPVVRHPIPLRECFLRERPDRGQRHATKLGRVCSRFGKSTRLLRRGRDARARVTAGPALRIPLGSRNVVVADHSFAALNSNERPFQGAIQQSIHTTFVDANIRTIREG